MCSGRAIMWLTMMLMRLRERESSACTAFRGVAKRSRRGGGCCDALNFQSAIVAARSGLVCKGDSEVNNRRRDSFQSVV